MIIGQNYTLILEQNCDGFSLKSMQNRVYKRCTFRQAVFDRTKFWDTVFIDCEFQDAIFDNCDLSQVTFINCDLSLARMTRVKINFHGVTIKGDSLV